MKMRNRVSIFLCALCVTGALCGQQPTIGLQSIKAPSVENGFMEAEYIFQKVKEILVNSRNFEVLDRESLGIVRTEQEIQKDITSINAKVVEQGLIAGAENIIAGKLISVEYKKAIGLLQKSKIADQEVLRAVFSFSLDILDTETSQTLETQIFKVGMLNPNISGGLTEQEAFRSALNSLAKSMEKFLNRFVAKAIAILSIEEEKGGEAKKILINVGEAHGAKKNNAISVYEISSVSIGDRETIREKWIADVKIDAVEGAELSTASVTKGGKELLEKYNNQATLICKPK
ncbi:CsgG/HfaB family protein [Arenibacter sp. GZD96]|uniref:CsgG/HfaB family protein n=1 Tax=Aurantibrevibacter litoralis TaxID=3106030 RepID=UPI002AFFA63B|nr:CsgG/HfaB family protein [Arenibacter sp. GZD-96]MEA1785138.1 CsgG/HfaB family protein [Arenibacter sp. GZD-96]